MEETQSKLSCGKWCWGWSTPRSRCTSTECWAVR